MLGQENFILFKSNQIKAYIYISYNFLYILYANKALYFVHHDITYTLWYFVGYWHFYYVRVDYKYNLLIIFCFRRYIIRIIYFQFNCKLNNSNIDWLLCNNEKANWGIKKNSLIYNNYLFRKLNVSCFLKHLISIRHK